MAQNDIRDQIGDITTGLLQDDNVPEAVSLRINQLYKILSHYSQFSGKENLAEDNQEVQLSTGYAIRANEAAQCLFDMTRTVRFLKGIRRAIQKCLKTYPNQQVRVLYVGCGPYALFCTLLASIYRPEEITFTLLEINEKSFHTAKKLISGLELQDYIQEMHLADAITFKIPEGRLFNILLSETMDKALLKEALVPILLNLQPQLPPKIITIPQEVTVSATLYPSVETETGSQPEVNELADVTGQDLGVICSLQELVRERVSEHDYAKGPIPVSSMAKYELIAFRTKVKIYEEISLEEESSDITKTVIQQFKPLKIGDSLIFQYPLGQSLGIKYMVI